MSLKFLLFLPVAALFVYACVRSDSNRHSKQTNQNQSTTSDSGNATEIYQINLSVIDDATGKVLYSFNFEDKNVIDRNSFAIDNAESISKLKEWFSTQQIEDFQAYTLDIKAAPETPMGVIMDFKEFLQDLYYMTLIYKDNS